MNKKNHKNTRHADILNNSEMIDMKGVVAFLQYVGLVVTLIVINFWSFSFFLLKNISINTPNSSYLNQTSKINSVGAYHYLSSKPKVKFVSLNKTSNIKSSNSLAALVAYSKDNKTSKNYANPIDNKVLGVSTTSNGICSFKQGTNLYADNTKLKISAVKDANHVCVSSPDTSNSNYLWNVNGAFFKGNCVDLSSTYTSNQTKNLNINVITNDSKCSLIVERIN